MKIVLATPVYPPEIGGPATYIKELAERLQATHRVTIVAYASTSERIPGTTLLTVSKRRPLPVRLVKYFLTLCKASRGAEVIYVQNAVAAGLPATLVGWLRNIPVVLKFAGDEAWERASQERRTTKKLEEFLAAPEGGLRTRVFMTIQGFVLRHVQKVMTPSAYLADVIKRTYRIPAANIAVNYNAAEKEEVTALPATKVEHQVVATARLVEWKGIDGIIRATALLAKRFPNVRTVIAGDGPEEARLKSLAAELKVTSRVTFLGRVSRAETWHLRKTSEVYVLNSTYEGLPHTVLTSFAAEIPTVATDIPGTNEAVYHEKSGLLVEVGNDQALADAIARLFEDKKLQKQVVQGAKEILTTKFSWDAHLRELLGIFESVSANPVH